MIPYTTIPFLSAFFLVLVGVLIAQLWRHPSGDDYQQAIRQLQRQVNAQRREREDLQRILDSMRQQASQHDDQVAAGQRQVEQLQEERQTLEIELGMLHQQLYEMEERLRLDAAERARLSEQLRTLDASRSESELRLRSQLDSAEERYSRCLTQLREVHEQWGEERQQWQQQRAAASASEGSLREIIQQLRSELDGRVEQFETLQEDKEQALAAAAAERKRRSYAEQSLEALRGTLEQLQLDNEALAASQQEAWLRVDQLARQASAGESPAAAAPDIVAQSEADDGRVAFSFHQMLRRLQSGRPEPAEDTHSHSVLGRNHRTA